MSAARWTEDQLAAIQKGRDQALEGVKKSVPERDHLKACLEYLEMHPKVAWVQRVNTGMWKEEDRVIRFGFKGCSDIIGQLKDGRFVAFECKRVGETPSSAQQSFINTVWANNGIAHWGQLKHAQEMMGWIA